MDTYCHVSEKTRGLLGMRFLLMLRAGLRPAHSARAKDVKLRPTFICGGTVNYHIDACAVNSAEVEKRVRQIVQTHSAALQHSLHAKRERFSAAIAGDSQDGVQLRAVDELRAGEV
jgi:hypothetical protein